VTAPIPGMKVPLDRAYWLDTLGRAHRAIPPCGGLSAADAAKRTRILTQGQAKAAGVPYGTPATAAMAAYDPHRTVVVEPTPEDWQRAAAGGNPEPAPPADASADASPEFAPLPGVSQSDVQGVTLDGPTVPDSPAVPAPSTVPDVSIPPLLRVAQLPDLPPENISGEPTEPDASADGSAEPDPDCPRCGASKVCPCCGKRYVPVGVEEAEEMAHMLVAGIARGIVAGRLLAAGATEIPPLHIHMPREQRVAAGRVLRPIMMRMGGLGGVMQFATAGVVLVGASTTAAMTAHPVGACKVCKEVDPEGDAAAARKAAEKANADPEPPAPS